MQKVVIRVNESVYLPHKQIRNQSGGVQGFSIILDYGLRTYDPHTNIYPFVCVNHFGVSRTFSGTEETEE